MKKYPYATLLRPLFFYHSRDKKKQEFIPLNTDQIGLYVCGPTVYDRAHIGNARPVVVFDLLFRLLRYVYGETHVTYVRNITDVDDKINTRAKQEGITINALTNSTIRDFHDDINALNVLKPTIEPRATDHIDHMIAMIQTLIDKGFAYEAQGHVLFEVEKYCNYGHLSGRSIKEMMAGARVEIAPYKKNPMDFVLWKMSDDTMPGWHSPWGRGRPGWHIECSAMSNHYLGTHFDIHAGGIDLIFPHHENEIAQSCCAHSVDTFANVWMHNGHVVVEGKKMSKSAGNFLTVNELLQRYPGEVLRLALLMSHYRQPLDLTIMALDNAKHIWLKWRGIVERYVQCQDKMQDTVSMKQHAQQAYEAVFSILANDLNTPQMLSWCHDLAQQSKTDPAAALQFFYALQAIGFDFVDSQKTESHTISTLQEEEIESLIAKRLHAREQKDFSKADDIRQTLLNGGVIIEDTVHGTQWRKV